MSSGYDQWGRPIPSHAAAPSSSMNGWPSAPAPVAAAGQQQWGAAPTPYYDPYNQQQAAAAPSPYNYPPQSSAPAPVTAAAGGGYGNAGYGGYGASSVGGASTVPPSSAAPYRPAMPVPGASAPAPGPASMQPPVAAAGGPYGAGRIDYHQSAAPAPAGHGQYGAAAAAGGGYPPVGSSAGYAPAPVAGGYGGQYDAQQGAVNGGYGQQQQQDQYGNNANYGGGYDANGQYQAGGGVNNAGGYEGQAGMNGDYPQGGAPAPLATHGLTSSGAHISSPNQRAAARFTTPEELPAEEPKVVRKQSPARPAERIDRKQIPRPPPVESKFGKFYTRSGASPPPSNGEYSVIDEGNCSPRFVRLTTNNVAHEPELIDNTKLCIGAIIQPLATLAMDEDPVRMCSYPGGPIRCARCKAYINPFFKFVEGGHKFMCNICGMKNDVPADYKCNLDANGFRRDRLDRPELCRGTVEFAAGPDFIARPIQDPCYLFVIDVSYGAAVTGLIQSAVEGIRYTLDALARNERTRVGIITFDQSIQFYSLKPPRTGAQLFVVSDIDDPFVPCPADEVLVRVANPEYRRLLDGVLDMLPRVYDARKISSENTSSCMGAALSAATSTIRPFGGKVMVVQSNIPAIGAGSLKNRDNSSYYYTEKEKLLFVPQGQFYTDLSNMCAENAITVDLFVCANSYVDLATIGVMSTKTGGQVFMYPGFNARKDGEAVQRDLFHNSTRVTGFDAVMVVRTSTGLRVADYYGNFYHRRTHEMDLPTIDCDKAFGIRLEHDGKLKDGQEVCMQVALLYTNLEGARRIRVHTISVPVTSVMANIFRYADLDSIINLSLKQAVRQILTTTTPTESQEALTTACVDSLYIYRKYCASATSPGQLILPEPLKLLPLSTLGLIKNPLFQDGISADERAFLFASVSSMPTYVSVPFVCPRLFSLHDIPENTCIAATDGRVYIPSAMELSSASIDRSGMYLLDNSRYMYLYISEEVSQELFREVFDSKEGKRDASAGIVRRDDPTHISSRIQLLIATLRKGKPSFQNLQIVTQTKSASIGGVRSPTHGVDEQSLDETMFFSHLIEDGDSRRKQVSTTAKPVAKDEQPNIMSYIDFLCWVHKKIQGRFVS